MKLQEKDREKLEDIIIDCVQDQLAEWGIPAKVDRWGQDINVPLRNIMNAQCSPLIITINREVLKFIGELDVKAD